MEREAWSRIVPLVERLAPRTANRRYAFDWSRIILVYLWAVLHDRPICWACQAATWPGDLLPPRLPTPSTMTRRLRAACVICALNRLLRHMQRGQTRGLVSIIDGKALPVGPHSRDPDARWGRGASGLAKGYKLHLIAGKNGRIEAWSIQPLNVDERVVARRMVATTRLQGYLLGDAHFDDRHLYAGCRARGAQLVAPRGKPKRGLGHRLRDPSRMRAIDMLEQSHTHFGPQLMERRRDIERRFGQLCSAAHGLPPLPAWVRRQPRVERWVTAKLLVHTIVRRQRVRSA